MNLGVHIHHLPSGRWGFVGTLPAVLGDVRPCEGTPQPGRHWIDAKSGRVVGHEFPTFETEADARFHAASRSVALSN